MIDHELDINMTMGNWNPGRQTTMSNWIQGPSLQAQTTQSNDNMDLPPPQ